MAFVRKQHSDALFGIGKKPLQPAAADARERRSRAIRPIEIQKRQAGRVELRATLDEVLTAAMRTSDGSLTAGDPAD